MEKGRSLRESARRFGIPITTLHNYSSGKVKVGEKSGPKRYLSEQEEEKLSEFIIGCSKIGFPRTRREIIKLAEDIIASNGRCVNATVGWWNSFIKRHESLQERRGEALSKARLRATNRDVLDRYFDMLEDVLRDNDLLLKPGSIYNCDESGFPLQISPGKVVVPSGLKHAYVSVSGDKTRLTVMACVSASGTALPPFIVYDRKRLNLQWTDGEIPGTAYGFSPKGWMDSDLFMGWFQDHFIPHASNARPLLLLLDGHSSHYNPVVVRKAMEENIIIFCLPPNTTHLTQPLDKTCFSSLKLAWQKECARHTTRHFGENVTRANFSSVFARAWQEAMTMKNISASFKMTGIYPLNRKAIILPGEEGQAAVSPTPGNDSLLSYVPFITPRKNTSAKRNATTDDSFSDDENSGFVEVTTLGQCFQRLSFGESHVKESDCAQSLIFTEEEDQRFGRRYDNGYDLKTDARYNAWVRERHPEPRRSNSPVDEGSKKPSSAMPIQEQRIPKIIEGRKKTQLTLPSLPVAKRMLQKKESLPSSRVMTSRSVLKELEMREQKKKRK